LTGAVPFMPFDTKPTEPVIISARTDSLPQKEKFSYWNEVICRTVVDLDCRPVERDRFEASIGGFDMPGLGVYDIRTQAHLVYREAPEISRLDNDALVINFVTEGQLYSEQDGRSAILSPGDGAVSDAARPYFLRFDQPLGCVSVKVFKSVLADRVCGIERITASSMARGSTLNPLVYGYLTDMIKIMPVLKASAAHRATNIFIELLCASLSEQLAGVPAPLSEYRAVALLRIKSFLETHLYNPDLDTRFVARGLKLSPRYINKLFEADKTSLGRYIWLRRLERCAAKLRDPAFAQRGISAIALANGFNDLSHFSRAFRLRFGESPTSFRSAALRSAQPSVILPPASIKVC
jgi:AraC family transcriptional regulator, positive regulator of tynA and feaB